MKKDLKCENNVISALTLNHLSGLTRYENRPKTPKLWAIAHENGQKTRKQRVFGHSSQTCLGSYGPSKSRWHPKTVGDIS
jgi:hypothetical protein